MQSLLQDGLTTCLPHHRGINEPAIANLQSRGLARAHAIAPPLTEFVTRDEASLTSRYIQ